MTESGLPSVPQLFAEAAQRHADRPFIVTDTGTETFAETAAAVASAADVLRKRRVRAGDRVMVLAANSPALVHAWLGSMVVGALPVALNPASTAPELRAIHADLSPAIVLADEERLAVTRAVGRATALAELRAGSVGDLDGPAARASDPAALVYTSGTTSRPKGAIVTHAAYVLTGEAFPSWVGLSEHERLWACMPLFHMNAQAYALMTAIAHGYALALTARFSASAFWGQAAALEVTQVNLVGAMLELLARQPRDADVASTLRLVYTAPAPPPNRRDELERRFSVRIVGGYGMTESPFGCIESETSRSKPSCIGRPRQHPWRAVRNDLRIVGGELQFRNPTVTPGYWNADAETRRVRTGDWLRTGDLGHIDSEGDVVLTGRIKAMIRRRGENIAPGEVESVLMAHDAVAAAAVVGIPSELTEEDVVAAVVVREGATVQEHALRDWCAGRLAAFKVPDRIEVVDALPMTPTMRVAKSELAGMLTRGNGAGRDRDGS